MTGGKKLVPFALATLAAAAVTSPAIGAARQPHQADPLGAQPARITADTTDRSDVFTRAVVRRRSTVAAPFRITAGPTDRSDVFTRAVIRHRSTVAAPVSVSTSSGAGFHWVDAGIGAVAGAVACLALLIAAGRFLRPHRSATAH